jgi:hypothetical protein
MDIYEADYVSNKNLQEICDLKQPVVFDMTTTIANFIGAFSLENILCEGSAYPVSLKDINDYNTDEIIVDYITIPFKTALKLIDTDTNSKYFSDGNAEFMDESGMEVNMRNIHEFLKPSFTIQTKYDLMVGSNGAYTPFKYTTDYRKFLIVSSGKITIKMTPFKNTKYLREIRDYENYEFRSPIDVWNTQKKYLSDMDMIKFVESTISKGSMIYIPPYWWYSIKYSTTEEDAAVIDITYNTIMNKVSYLPDNIKYFMQQQNTMKRINKISESSKDPDPSKLALDMGDDDETDDGVGEGSIGIDANVKEVEASNAMNAI